MKNILVVDDEDVWLSILSTIVEGIGHKPTKLDDPTLVLDSIRSGDYDALIIDNVMPQMLGYELIRRIRTYDAGRYLPILMATGFPSEELVSECERLDSMFVEKNLGIAAITSHIEQMLGYKKKKWRENPREVFDAPFWGNYVPTELQYDLAINLETYLATAGLSLEIRTTNHMETIRCTYKGSEAAVIDFGGSFIRSGNSDYPVLKFAVRQGPMEEEINNSLRSICEKMGIGPLQPGAYRKPQEGTKVYAFKKALSFF